MIRVAVWKAKGMNAGRVVKLREHVDPQRWRVDLRIDREDGQRDEHTIRSGEPIPLASMFDTIMASIDEVTAAGAAKIIDGRMDFYVESGRR